MTRSVIVVAGTLGSGRRTLIELALRDARVASAAQLGAGFDILEGDLRAIAAHVRALQAEVGAAPDRDRDRAPGPAAVAALGDDQARLRERRFAALADGLDALARRRPACVVLREDPDAEAFAAFVAGAEPSGRLLILLPARAALGRPFADTIALAPLAAETVAELVRRAAGADAPAAAVAQIARASAGHAGTTALLTRRLIDAVRQGDADRFRIETAADLPALLDASFVALPSAARGLVATLGLGLGPDALADIEIVAAAARDAGWLVEELRSDGARGWRLPSDAHRRIAVGRLREPDLRLAADRAIRELPADDVGRAEALVALDRGGEAAAVFLRAADAAVAEGDLGRAAAHLLRAEVAAPGAMSCAATLALATGLAILGRYDEAQRRPRARQRACARLRRR